MLNSVASQELAHLPALRRQPGWCLDQLRLDVVTVMPVPLNQEYESGAADVLQEGLESR
jgi:hypothetical protein